MSAANGSSGTEIPIDPPAGTEERPFPKGSLEAKMERFLAGISFGVALTGDQFCAGVLARQAHPLAEAWGELARENAQVRRIIELMISGGAWGNALSVTAMTMLPILAHHGLVPAGVAAPFGMVPPSEEVAQAAADEAARGPVGPQPPPASGMWDSPAPADEAAAPGYWSNEPPAEPDSDGPGPGPLG